MTRRNLSAVIIAGLFTGIRGAPAAIRGARYRVRRRSATKGRDAIVSFLEFHVTADEAFPVRALDPVLHIGQYQAREYRYGNMENTLLIFTCGEPDKLDDNALVYFQYENDETTRTDLPPFRRADIQ
ncbi:MAG: hypothetical protein HY820_43435 [Acidobacteria bacterium]|nr:hypothetical protein [Acidobacteriota bacterium]